MGSTLENTVALADGRTLAYRDTGGDGPAVVFNPGFMACRLTGPPGDDVGVRVITVDRPGIGLSDPKPGRTVLDWADDVAALADQLGLDHFAVLGHSGGSPFAAACAHRLPDRVGALGIACGFAPMDRPGAVTGVNPRMARALPGLRRAPWMARLAMSSLPRQYRRDPAAAFDKQFGRDLPACDTAALQDEDVRRVLLDAAVEATRQGSRPLAVEAQLIFARPWGFDPGTIKVATRLWYGAADTLTPPQMGDFLRAQIPGAQLTVYPEEGHMALFTHWPEIVAALTVV